MLKEVTAMIELRINRLRGVEGSDCRFMQESMMTMAQTIS